MLLASLAPSTLAPLHPTVSVVHLKQNPAHQISAHTDENDSKEGEQPNKFQPTKNIQCVRKVAVHLGYGM
jgi:hypothetical protein